MKFVFKNNATGHEVSANLDDDFIRERMSDYAHDKLSECNCRPTAPESNLVECNCCDKYELYELDASAEEMPSPKIKLSKKLPTEDGLYMWSNKCGGEVVPELVLDLEVECPTGGYMPVSRIGGYWAKVEQDHFEFEDASNV